MKLCLLTAAGNLSVVFNSCASRAESETEPQKVSGRMGPGDKTESGRIVNDGRKWPRDAKTEMGSTREMGISPVSVGTGRLEALELMLSRCAGAKQAFEVLEQLGSGSREIKSALNGARVGFR